MPLLYLSSVFMMQQSMAVQFLPFLNQLMFVCVRLGIGCLQKLESCLHLLKYLCREDLILLYLFIITLIFRVQYCVN